ncbi:hypothetical protein DX130_06125 [Paenibacillus paeoniae]|uniref:FAD-binding PCMH-type domain-containing protein n=1 Tax=Paenibacillus paeoniae TaxID=2292705 RepID=A0A371PKE1_9BACL|nr:hypothetical protein DX130_06125 [Paenibacillus paeoniae]
MAIEMADYLRADYSNVWQPASVEEAWHLKRKFGGKASYAAGGTLLRTQWQNGVRPEPKHLISLSSIPELQGIRLSEETLSIGARAALDECHQHPLLNRHGELLVTAIGQIAAPAIRHLATIGGNISSLIGDAVPALTAMNAEVVVFRGSGWSQGPILDWVRGKNGAREPDDLLVRVILPVVTDSERAQEELFAFYEKVSRHDTFVPSIVTVVKQDRVSEDGHRTELQVSAEAESALPTRLRDAAPTMNGSRLSDNMLGLIHEAIKGQYKAAEELFAGSDYRKEATANLISARLWKMIKHK